MLKVSRGSLFICETCYHIIEESGQIEGDRATSELCPNCEDQNKPLLDDLLGSEE
jgi:rubrerythrin